MSGPAPSAVSRTGPWDASRVDGHLFDEAADVVRSMLPEQYGHVHVRARRWGMKLWFGPEEPPRVHYEAQVIGSEDVAEAEVLAMEIGLHLEERNLEINDRVLGSLTSSENRWRRKLGDEVVAGPFLGRPEDWRRVSETWPDPDLDEPDLGLEVGGRVVDYICALEPLLRRET